MVLSSDCCPLNEKPNCQPGQLVTISDWAKASALALRHLVSLLVTTVVCFAAALDTGEGDSAPGPSIPSPFP